MKKLLLILLCVPFTLIGQEDCGDKPIYKGNKFANNYRSTPEYKKYKQLKEDWDLCQSINEQIADSNALFKQIIPIDSNTNKYTFEGVVQAPNFSKEQLYNFLREWFVIAFVNAESVLQMQDKEAGILIGKGRSGFDYSWINHCDLGFTVKIYIKEGRFKYVFTDFKQYYEAEYDKTISKSQNKSATLDKAKIEFSKKLQTEVEGSSSIVTVRRADLYNSVFKSNTKLSSSATITGLYWPE